LPPVDAERPLVERYVALATRKLARALERCGADVARQLRAYTKLAKAKDPKKRADEIAATLTIDLDDAVDALGDDLEGVAADAAVEALVSVGLQDDEQIVDVVNERAVAIARDQAAALVGKRYDANGNLVEAAREDYRIDDATRDMIRDTIADGLAENIGLDEIAAQIEDGTAFGEDRAELVARTEIARANSQGALVSYREARDQGVVVRKEWLIADDDCCDDCQENADAGAIDVDDDFPSGDDSPPQHPRCRCAVSPVVADDGDQQQGDGE
jgi:SPP1 gp7 family putative phage head morphogenesis protein